MNPLKLEDQICFPLYAASKEIIKRYKPFLEGIGLTYTQYIVMLVLWDISPIGVKALGEKLHLDSGTLTPVLKRLEHQGLLVRKRATRDERNLEVTLTQAGLVLRERALEVPSKIAKCVNLTPEEGTILYQLLYKILNEECEEVL